MNSYEQITNQIITNLENAKTWSDMINARNPINITGRAYRGINIMLLYNASYKSRIWGTFRQIIKHGGKVNKGEKSSLVGFWSKYKPTPTKQAKELVEVEERWYLKVYRVFNVEQCEFIEGNEYLEALEGKLNEEPVPTIPQELTDDYLRRESIELDTDHFNPVAMYSPGKDSITMPDRSIYTCNDEFFMTLFHEMAHSTGHPKRLNRFEVSSSKYDFDGYCLEELVAEIAANFLSAETGINPDFFNSLAYIKGWIPSLKEHPRWIVSAAAKAERAVEYILKGGMS